MNQGASPESKANFRKEALLRYALPEITYKVLECIFRHYLMVDRSRVAIQYDRDEPDLNILKGELTPQERLAAINGYIAQWERRHGLEYGLEGIAIPSLVTDEIQAEQYNQLVNELDRLKELPFLKENPALLKDMFGPS